MSKDIAMAVGVACVLWGFLGSEAVVLCNEHIAGAAEHTGDYCATNYRCDPVLDFLDQVRLWIDSTDGRTVSHGLVH